MSSRGIATSRVRTLTHIHTRRHTHTHTHTHRHTHTHTHTHIHTDTHTHTHTHRVTHKQRFKRLGNYMQFTGVITVVWTYQHTHTHTHTHTPHTHDKAMQKLLLKCLSGTFNPLAPGMQKLKKSANLSLVVFKLFVL